MAKTRSMTRKENHDSSSKKRFKTCDNGATWSDLNHDLLFLVMMQLGVVDFLAFGGVCKSWRSFALSNRNKFMMSRSPISIFVSTTESNEEDYYFYLEDHEGRKFKTILPHSAGTICMGLTCEYVILFGLKTNDFWLVNPITRHELHFPNIPCLENDNPKGIRAILVFSPSISGWVFVMTNDFTNIWFSIAGQRTWNYVSSTFPIHGLHASKGKMYIIDNSCRLCELILNPEPKLILIETKNFPTFSGSPHFLRLRENLSVLECSSKDCYKFYKLDFDKMNWQYCEKTREEFLFIYRKLMHIAPPVEVKDGKGKLFIGSI